VKKESDTVGMKKSWSSLRLLSSPHGVVWSGWVELGRVGGEAPVTFLDPVWVIFPFVDRLDGNGFPSGSECPYEGMISFSTELQPLTSSDLRTLFSQAHLGSLLSRYDKQEIPVYFEKNHTTNDKKN